MTGITLHTVELEDGTWFAESSAAPGCWGAGMTRLSAEEEFCSALRDWYNLKAEDGDPDLPPMELSITGEFCR